MVHKSDLSWTVKVNNPADLYHKGDDVEAIILSINHDEKKVSPRHQAALGRSVADASSPSYPPGKVVEGDGRLSVVDYGVFVRVRDGVEGLIPQNEIVVPKDEDGEDKPLKIGDEVEAEIANIDSQERRITLSMRIGEARRRNGARPRRSREARVEGAEEAARRRTTAGGTIGELIKQKLGDKLRHREEGRREEGRREEGRGVSRFSSHDAAPRAPERAASSFCDRARLLA